MIPRTATVAFNPLQWFTTPDGFLDWGLSPELPALMADIKKAGFDAAHTRIPEGVSADEYGKAVREAGLTPAAGTTAVNLPEAEADIERDVDAIRSLARAYSTLGLSEVFIMARVGPEVRINRPALGTDADDARLDRFVEVLSRAGEAAVAEGVLPILHPHVGTWIETEQETRYVLEHVDEALLGFGPDIGHLSWAGADPILLIEEYRDRVRGVHMKDFRRSVLDDSTRRELSYRETVLAGLWIEPGRGDFAYDRLWNALGDDFGGTLVVEVDRGDIQPAFASAQASARWVASQRVG